MSVRLQLLLCVAPLVLGAETRLLRFPDIHENRVVFVYAGDLWTVSDQGGDATRLTAHPGLERFPKFSPDGRWIAFTGQYDGYDQVYIIPSNGGTPLQLTWYPSKPTQGPISWSQVYGWMPDGKSVIFRSNREFWDGRDGRLYTVSTKGGLPAPLEMPISGAGDVSKDGEFIVFTPNCVESQWWRGYRGGWAQDLHLLNRRTLETTKITSYRGTDHAPMWINSQIYFASDRSGKFNLHRWVPESNEIEQLTNHTQFDIRWPSSDSNRRIVFELHGALKIYDVETSNESSIPIRVSSDYPANIESLIDASRNIETVKLSPDGKRVVISARGDIFTLPPGKGTVRNLTRSSSHDRLATWSPDGSMIAFVSDRNGEEQVYKVTQDQSSEPEQLTINLRTRIYDLKWAPDSEMLSFYDKDGNLYILHVETKMLTKIYEESRFPDPSDYDHTWSPDGEYIAFSAGASFLNRSIHIWDRQTSTVHRVGSTMFNEYNPAWSDDGHYLYYLSEREFTALSSNTEWNFATDQQTIIVALALKNDAAHPFPPESDEVDTMGLGKDLSTAKSRTSTGTDPISIDFEQLNKRVALVPMVSGNYSQLIVSGQYIGVISSPTAMITGSQRGEIALQIFDTIKRKMELISNVDHWEVSTDGSTILVRKGDSYYVKDLPLVGSTLTSLKMDRLLVKRVRSREWATIFQEAWRRFRDFFYVRNMHGFSWEEIRARYEELLPYVSHRADLNYLIGEMVSELHVSHIVVTGGDMVKPRQADVALLGADFVADLSSGYYRIRKILEGHNEETIYRSPLTEIGADIHEGDYIMAIDGVSLKSDDNPYRLLHNRDMSVVRLLVNEQPSLEGARTILVRPIRNEANLRYFAWVEKNRKYVRGVSDGTVGYVHLPSMADRGMYEFLKWFYPQMRMLGLVIDVRGNTGGFISQIVLERLLRERLGFLFLGTSSDYLTYPSEGFFGKMACLINEKSASDGEIFPLRFRAAGLGPLVGKRTWGGTVGTWDLMEPLMDGGVVAVPMAGIVETHGNWSIENEGAEPDIVVHNDVKSVVDGRDLQLERAVEEVLKAIEDDPVRPVMRPADPVR